MNKKLLFNTTKCITKRFYNNSQYTSNKKLLGGLYCMIGCAASVVNFPILMRLFGPTYYDNYPDTINHIFHAAGGSLALGMIWPITSLIGLYHIATKQTHKI